MNGKNIEITKVEIEFIRELGDFDLTMLLSEIHEHGWPAARKLMLAMAEAIQRESAGRA